MEHRVVQSHYSVASVKRLEHQRNFPCENNNLYALAVLNFPLNSSLPQFWPCSLSISNVFVLWSGGREIYLCGSKKKTHQYSQKSTITSSLHSVISLYQPRFFSLTSLFTTNLFPPNPCQFSPFSQVLAISCLYGHTGDQSATIAPESQAPSHWSGELDLTCHLPLCSRLEGWNQPGNAVRCQDMNTDYEGGSNTELPTQSPVLASWLSSMKISFQWVEVVFRVLKLAPANPHTVTFHMCRDMIVDEFGSDSACQCNCVLLHPHGLFYNRYTHPLMHTFFGLFKTSINQ